MSVWEQHQYADPLVGRPGSQGRERQPSVATCSLWEALYNNYIKIFPELNNFHNHNKCSIIRKTLKGRKQTKMEGGQSSTYLQQTRASSGPRVSVSLLYSTAEEGHCDLAEIFVSSLYVLTMLTRRPENALVYRR